MKKYLYLLAALAMGAAACTNDPADEVKAPAGSGDNTTNSGLTTVKLSTFASSQERVVAAPQTKAYPYPVEGKLTLFYTIENPSRQGGVPGFVKEENGRYLSATCVYYDASTETYYATYHMQGNNYNTQQDNETAGLIESFKMVQNEDGEYVPQLGTVYYAANSASETFDFNHLYFDDLSNTANSGGFKGKETGTRIIAVGHKSKPSSKEGGEPNTAAIIGQLKLADGKFEYAKVHTAEKIYDLAGRVIDKVDAGDVNCVIRKYDWYYLATRKGLAVLNAREDLEDKALFSPINNVSTENYQPIENSVYFVNTPGSAKHLAHYYPSYGSGFSFLYLTEDTPDGFNGETKIPASLINFSMNQGDGTLCGMSTTDSQTTGKAIFDTTDFDITGWSNGTNQFKIAEEVYPVDGKNVLANLNGRLYACLGKGGLYVRKSVTTMEGPSVIEDVIKFSDKKEGGSRPVNGVFVEDVDSKNDGFVYVANGACLTILDRETLEIVADYTAYDSKAEENLASANYVHVYKTNEYEEGRDCPNRIVTVAYGQAGVKVFKYTPAQRE